MLLKRGGFLLLVSAILLLSFYSSNLSQGVGNSPPQAWDREVRQRPLFLWWTTFHRRQNDLHLLEPLRNCTYQCAFTINCRLLDKADVVVFHGGDLDHQDMPETQLWQLKMFIMLESPGRRNHFYTSWANISMSYFNLTATYRNDSDYWLPYFQLKQSNTPMYSDEQIDAAVRKKTRDTFSLISNCYTVGKREDIISALGRLTGLKRLKSIIVWRNLPFRYGKCAEACNQTCEEQAIESSHFFLALENSVCEQYITEKFQRFRDLIVPITAKRSIVPEFVPGDAFIAVDDFCSIESLADYLNYLMSNATAYKSYFSWTKSHSLTGQNEQLCQLCEDLHRKKVKTRDYSEFPNILGYFSTSDCYPLFGREMLKNRCRNPTISQP